MPIYRMHIACKLYVSFHLLAASEMCHWDTRMQTASPWKIPESLDFQGEFSKVPDKGWNKASTSNTLSPQNESDMLKFNKAYEPINKAGFHIQAVYCKIPQGDIV